MKVTLVELLDMVDMDTKLLVMEENTKCAVRNTRPRLTRSPLSPSPLSSPVCLPTLPPSRSVSPRLLRSPRLSARTRLRTSASMLPSLLMLPTLLTRRRLSLENPAVNRSLLHSQPNHAARPMLLQSIMLLFTPQSTMLSTMHQPTMLSIMLQPTMVSTILLSTPSFTLQSSMVKICDCYYVLIY